MIPEIIAFIKSGKNFPVIAALISLTLSSLSKPSAAGGTNLKLLKFLPLLLNKFLSIRSQICSLSHSPGPLPFILSYWAYV